MQSFPSRSSACYPTSALGESLSREARRKVEAENSWQFVATQYEAVYRDALVQPESTKGR